MNLSKYEDTLKEQMERVPFPISEDELVARYEGVFVSAVNDVLREDGLLEQALPYTIMPLREEMKVCGFAFTIKGEPSLEADVDMEMKNRAKMLEEFEKNDVVVWDTSSDSGCAQWGEMMTKAVKKRGCRGAVIDGGVRDTAAVLKQEFPVFCRYRSSNAMLGRFRTTDHQRPIKIGGVRVFPGDVVFADIDGVIIVPRRKAYDVLLRAEAIRDKELVIDKMIASGMKPTEVVKQGGYF